MTDLRDAVAQHLPDVEEVWRRTFINIVAEWAVPLPPRGTYDPLRFKSSRGSVVAVQFSAEEWFGLIVDLYVRFVKEGDLRLDGGLTLRDDLWSDELYDLFFNGAPCIAIRDGAVVALESPHGARWHPRKPWARRPDGSGTWSAEPG